MPVYLNRHVLMVLKWGLFLFLFSMACSKTPDITFDSEAWKKDKKGCDGRRLHIYKELIGQKTELMGLGSNKIHKILGKPDINELYKRNQKFFVYYVEPAGECNEEVIEGNLFLIIRFNALGLANEIYMNEEHDPTR